MGRLRYVLFCRNGEKAVDGGTGICYTIIWYFTVLVWLSWQSMQNALRSLLDFPKGFLHAFPPSAPPSTEVSAPNVAIFFVR